MDISHTAHPTPFIVQFVMNNEATHGLSKIVCGNYIPLFHIPFVDWTTSNH